MTEKGFVNFKMLPLQCVTVKSTYICVLLLSKKAYDCGMHTNYDKLH